MIDKKIKLIQTAIKKLESKSRGVMSNELNERIHQIHGEMYGYLLLNSDINKKLDVLYKEIVELNGDSKISKH